MIKEFKSFVKSHQLFETEDTILLAFSGGADSVCLLDLLLKTTAKVVLAHVNFQLRGEESHSDEIWVKTLSEKKGLTCHVTRFDTKSYANVNGLSIEEAARNLRYDWFGSLLKQFGYQHLATAHQADDQTETYLLNLVKGRGISGQTGILPKRDWIIRPLLFASKLQIIHYCQENQLDFRIDSSNLDTGYQRNFLRLNVIPLLQELNPSLNSAIEKEIEYRRQASFLLEDKIKALIEEATIGDSISLDSLKSSPQGLLAFYRFMERFDFNYTQCLALWKAKQNGKRLISSTFTAVLHQGFVAVKRNYQPDSEQEHLIHIGKNLEPFPIHCEIVETSAGIKLPGKAFFFDASLLQFPLRLRTWRKGDYFFPSGMKGKKKVSDFFIDHKMSIFEKNSTWLLCSGDAIIWVVGKRQDGRFIAKENTNQVLQVTIP